MEGLSRRNRRWSGRNHREGSVSKQLGKSLGGAGIERQWELPNDQDLGQKAKHDGEDATMKSAAKIAKLADKKLSRQQKTKKTKGGMAVHSPGAPTDFFLILSTDGLGELVGRAARSYLGCAV